MSRFTQAASRATLGLVLAVTSAHARESEPAPSSPPTTPIVAELTVNGAHQGDVFPLLRGEDVLLPVSVLVAAGVDPRWLPKRVEVIDGKAYVSLPSLAPPARCQLDPDTTQLTCELPPEAFAVTRVNLAPGPPAGYQLTGSPSAFLNYAAHARNTSLSLFGEVGLSLDRALATTQARWTPGGAPLRGLSQLTVDFPEVMVRAIAGEATGYGGVLGGGAVVAGLHVLRSFELNPYFIRNPVQDLAGDVTTPSTLEVYVNNRLVRRTELPPGPYRLENLTLPRGEGITRYVVRDAFGRTREVSSAYSLGAQLLAPGVADYQLSVGVERKSLSTRSFDYGQPLLLGHFRMGATPWLTPGLRLELSPDLLSTGAVQWLQLPLGEVEFSQAVSISQRRAGAAAGTAYTVQGHQVGGSVFARVMSPAYANTSLPLDAPHARLETGGSLFVALGGRFSLTGQAQLRRWKSLGWTTWLGATTTVQVTGRTLLSFSARRNQEPQHPSSLEGMVSLTAILDTLTSGSVSHTQARGGGLTAADMSRGIPLEGGLGFQVQGQVGRHDMALARVDYDAEVGHCAAGAEWREGVMVAAAEVSGGVVALGGRIHATRAVDQGYALVRVDGVKGIGVRLNNHLIGKTDAQGELVVTRLQAYGLNRLSLTDEDLPLEMYIPATERQVAPWRRGGVVLEFQVDTVRAFRGRLVLSEGTPPRVPAHGEVQVVVNGQRWSSPIGWQGEFELVGLPPGRHPAAIRYTGGHCTAVLEVPAQTGQVIDLGTVRCVDE
ncbi:fimbria/pilus outer membrane usher protein [Myxococcus stipitatus]|uniref:fimbria/pilus outer membrane usher protein n=1 Tax=Myxococcus stipitatus TaxID=83455 RepID=UPI0030D1A273